MASVPLDLSEVNGTTANGHTAVDAEYDVIIVGAGFSGISALHRLRTDGLKAHIFEAGTCAPNHINGLHILIYFHSF